MKTPVLILTALIVFAAPAYPWGNEGHQAIAQAALAMLHGTPAEQKINAILGDESTADAATWLDRVREHVRFDSQEDQEEADSFSIAFPSNANWHFTNFIVGSAGYSLDSKYATPDDVVHALETAIAVLEGAQNGMTKLQALRTVIHLCGDIHQPLHCVTGYYDLSNMNHPVLLNDVATAADLKNTPEDRGGNQLYYTSSQELHALWDTGLPSRIARDMHGLADAISVTDFTSVFKTDGDDYHKWPEAWATDTIQQGNKAYDGIIFQRAQLVPNPQHQNSTMLKITASLPGETAGYKQNKQTVAQNQLSKAAVHLAQLLNAIQFAP